VVETVCVLDDKCNYVDAKSRNTFRSRMFVKGVLAKRTVCCYGTGLSTAEGVHSNSSTAATDDRRLLADVVGTQLDHRRYADQAARDGQGR